MNRLSFMAILAAVTLLGTMSSAAAGVMRNVNCDKGQSIQKALDTSTGYGGVIEVVITGFCEENISIARDVVVRGVNGARISGQVTIAAARNVEISDLTITGPGHGLVINSGTVTLRSVSLTGNGGSAIIARRNATVRVWECQISDNLTESEGGNAVALYASVAWLRQTDVVDNHGWGVNVFNRSQLEVTRGTVSRNGGPGLHVTDGSQLRIFETEVADKEAAGIVVRLNSNA